MDGGDDDCEGITLNFTVDIETVVVEFDGVVSDTDVKEDVGECFGNSWVTYYTPDQKVKEKVIV